MRCVACDNFITHPSKRALSIPHPDGTPNKKMIVHEDEVLCSKCIGYSELRYNYEDPLDLSDLGLSVDIMSNISEDF